MCLSMTAATAVCLAFSASAGAGKTGNLNLVEATTDSVSVTTTADTDKKWNSKPSVVNSYYEIDNDETPNQYRFDSSDKKYYTCQLAMKVASVPVDAIENLAGNADAQVGFCVYSLKNGKVSNHYAAYVNSGWVDLGASGLAEDATYTLTVTFDYSDGQYVQFKVGETVLSNGETSWFATGKGATTVGSYVFVGSGYVGAFNRKAYVIESEAVPGIVIDDGQTVSVTLSETSLAALATEAGGKANLASYLGDTGANGLMNLDTYALFGKARSTAADKLTVASDAVNSTAGGIAISAPAVNIPADMADHVSFQLMGCATKDGEYEAVEGVDPNTTGSFTIPLGKIGTYKFFKIRATTSYTPAN